MTDQPSVYLNGATDLDYKGFWPGVQTVGLVGLVIAGLVALAACQATAEKDSRGRTMQLSEWKEIELYDVDLNIPRLVSVKITKAERQVRDNQVNHDRLTLDNGKGEIFTERIPLLWYSLSTQEQIKDKSAFELEMKKYFGNDLVDIEEIRNTLHRSANSGGYLSIVRVKGPSKKCLYSLSGYRFGITPYDDDPGLFDTYMTLIYCDPDVTPQHFSELFSNLGLRP